MTLESEVQMQPEMVKLLQAVRKYFWLEVLDDRANENAAQHQAMVEKVLDMCGAPYEP